MIAAMDQLTVIGRRSLAQELLVSLQSLGVVHIDPLEPSEEALKKLQLAETDLKAKNSWDAATARSAGFVDALGLEALEAVRSDLPTTLGEVEEYLKAVGAQIDALISERADIRDELDLIESYLPSLRDIAPGLAQFENSRYLAATAFAVPNDKVAEVKQNLSQILADNIAIAERPRNKDALLTVVAHKRDRDALRTAISRAGYSEISLPDRFSDQGLAKTTHLMEERSQTLPQRLKTIEGELAKLAAQHGSKLKGVYQIASNHQARYERLQDMASGRFGFALRGWMPSSERTKVVEGLKKQFGEDIVVETRAADEHHDHNVPVKLDNPNWIRPFEGLLALFAPPKYGAFDPSWTLAVFFPLFFGLVVGDIGFGLMFAAIAWWMRRRGEQGKELSLGILGITIKPAALLTVSTVIFWCAAWSILFGFMFGEFFGNFLEKVPVGKPIFYTTLHHEPGYGLIHIPLFRVEVFTPLLLISIGFGVLQVVGGWIIRTILGIRHHDMKHVYEGIGMASGLVALIIFATAFLTNNVNPVVNGIVIIGLLAFLVCAVLAKMPLMLIELVSNGGAILSYLRLFAVGLSAAIVANLATDLGWAIGGSLPVIGPILGVVVGLAVHLIAMALTIIGHTLQPLRLHYVEFFTKFGFYDENGRPYKPFRLLGGKA